MSPLLHQRLLNEATSHGTVWGLRLMTAPYSPELEQAIRQGVRSAVLFYVDKWDTLQQRLNPLEHGKVRA